MAELQARYYILHLGVLRQYFLEVNEEGLSYKGTSYTWDDVEQIQYSSGKGTVYNQYSAMRICLKDQVCIYINAESLRQKGVKAELEFFTSKNSVFEELLAFVSQKTELISGPWEAKDSVQLSGRTTVIIFLVMLILFGAAALMGQTFHALMLLVPSVALVQLINHVATYKVRLTEDPIAFWIGVLLSIMMLSLFGIILYQEWMF